MKSFDCGLECIAEALQLPKQITIKELKLSNSNKSVSIILETNKDCFPCPQCSHEEIPVSRMETKKCRYFPFFNFQTYIEMPQIWVKCSKHGEQKVQMEWERKLSESLNISRLI